MRTLEKCWKIMRDPQEPSDVREECEAEVREHAIRGCLPPQVAGALDKATVLEVCSLIREELGVKIGPQPVRFTDRELLFMMALLNGVEADPGTLEMVRGLMARLRHRERSMRNERNREEKYAVS